MIYRWYELMGKNILSFKEPAISLFLFYFFNIEKYRLIRHNLKILQIKLSYTSFFILSILCRSVQEQSLRTHRIFLQERGQEIFIKGFDLH